MPLAPSSPSAYDSSNPYPSLPLAVLLIALAADAPWTLALRLSAAMLCLPLTIGVLGLVQSRRWPWSPGCHPGTLRPAS